MIVIAVLAAGAVGAAARYLVGRAFASRTNSGASFPRAVLVVNVLGSLLGGVLLAVASGDTRLILLTGLCGGLTTFSTFSVETIQLVSDGKLRVALSSVTANLVLGIGAAALGYLVSIALTP